LGREVKAKTKSEEAIGRADDTEVGGAGREHARVVAEQPEPRLRKDRAAARPISSVIPNASAPPVSAMRNARSCCPAPMFVPTRATRGAPSALAGMKAMMWRGLSAMSVGQIDLCHYHASTLERPFCQPSELVGNSSLRRRLFSE
jgi:hypothetical protein